MILTEACRLVGEALGTARSKILEIQSNGSELLVRAGLGWQENIVGKLRLQMTDRSSETYSIKAAAPVITQDITREDRFDIPQFLKDARIVAFVNVPIFVPGGHPYGILQVDSTMPREFDNDDIQFLRTYSAVLGPVIDRLQLAEQRNIAEERRSADLAAMEELQRVSAELVGEHDAQSHYQRIVDSAAALMRSNAASTQTLDHATGRLQLMASRGFDPRSADFWKWVRGDTASSCGQALEAGERIVVSDIDRFEANQHDREAYRYSKIRSVQSTPLRAFSGRIVGMLSTHWHDRQEPIADDYRFFDVLARLSADLIERVQANDRLRESEDTLRQFGEASQDVLWLRDAETLQWQYLTPAFESIYGLSRDDALGGNNYRGWLELIVPEDRAIVEDAIRRIRQGERVTFDYRIRRPVDGGIRWLRDTDFPITDASGQIRVFGGVGHDLTELRETELRLRTLLDGIPHLVWQAVSPGEWSWASPQWTKYTGQSLSDSLGWGWLQALHPDDHETAKHAWAAAIEDDGFEVEYRIRRAETQSYHWFQTRGTPVWDDGGSISGWLGTSTDIDELRKLQVRQQVLVSELQHRTFNLMGMVRSMADETIRSSQSLADFKPKFRERVDALARVQRLLSRLEEGHRIFFDDLIKSELAAVGAFGEDSNDRVRLEGPGSVALRSSSVQTLAMAIHELTTNAVKYGALRQSSGRLYVGWRVERADSDGKPWLHVEWQETGVAMPASNAEPRGTGQGRSLIEEALPYQLQARTTYIMAPDGVKCSIALLASDQD